MILSRTNSAGLREDLTIVRVGRWCFIISSRNTRAQLMRNFLFECEWKEFPFLVDALRAFPAHRKQHAGSRSNTQDAAPHLLSGMLHTFALTNINFSTTRTCYLTSSTCLIFIVSKRMSLNEEFNPISTHKARVSWGDMDANAHVNNLMFFSKPISTFIAIDNLTCHSEWTQDARADFLMYKSMSSSPPPIYLLPCPPNSFSSPPSPRLTF